MTSQQLKNSILQMAVQGKLVPQDPNDEPASVLLERIRAEKQELIKQGKIKKEKNPSYIFKGPDNNPYEKIGDNEAVCIADEVPFEIPESWEWVRAKNLFNVVSAKRVLQSEWKSSGVPFYRAREVGTLSEKGNVDNELYISEELYDNLSRNGVPKENDLMITAVGTLGKTYIVKSTDKFYYKDASVICFENYGKIVPSYIKLAMESPYLKQVIKESSSGTTVGTITIVRANEYLFPIPPLAEQCRIVSKIEELLPYITEYEKAEKSLTALNKSFPDQLKKSILQQAVQGKLVPQDPNDEPASVLLERIRAEKQELIKAKKIKKDKNESVIFKRDNSHYELCNGVERCIDDEIPFEIPESWEWCRLGELFSHNTGKALNSSNKGGKMMTYITTSNLYWDRFELDQLKRMLFTDSEIDKCTVTKGDLLVCEGGDIGRSAIWNYEYPMRIQNHIHRLRSYIKLHTKFFYYVLYLYKQIGMIGGKGIGIQGLSASALHNILLPLPPLNEQSRIISKIEQTLPILSTL